jgi:serine/threonine-protein kinase CTR1
MLAKYRHPNIVLMLGAMTAPPQLLLVMELVKEGTLFDLLHRRRATLSEADKRKVALQLVGVVAYLHRMGIVHRDIKSHNILIDKNYSIKLCDFGLARHKVNNPPFSPSSTAAPCSSPARPSTWPNSSSRNGLTTNRWTSSPWELCSTSCTQARSRTTASTHRTSRSAS